MKITVYLSLIFVLLTDLAFAQEKPGLLVTPTRIELEGKRRSGAVYIVNNGNLAGTYKISVVNRRMLESGKIVKVEGEAQEGEQFADNMLRVSPRRVKLGPGERQSVRVLARKPSDLEDGEYRSHLNFSILPNNNLSEREAKQENIDDDSLTISIQANFGVTIPIILRHGEVSAEAQISDIKLNENDKGEKFVSFDINRQGNKSLYGDIEVVYYNTAGKEYVIKSMGGLAVYTPNDKRSFNIKLDLPDGVQIAGGSLDVVYTAKEKSGGEVLARSKLNL